MAVGRPPFETAEIEHTYELIKSGIYSFPDQAPVSEQLKDLISSCLVVQPQKRASTQELALHPFFTGQTIPAELPVCTLACPLSRQQVVDLASRPRQSVLTRTTKCSLAEKTIQTHRMSHKVLRKASLPKGLPKSLSVYRNSLKVSPYLDGPPPFFLAEHKFFKKGDRTLLGYSVQGGGVGFVSERGKGVLTLGLHRLLFYSRDSLKEVKLDDCVLNEEYCSAKATILQLA
jgi:serine/threonine protein kinase